jgi:hypothetical protein
MQPTAFGAQDRWFLKPSYAARLQRRLKRKPLDGSHQAVYNRLLSLTLD